MPFPYRTSPGITLFVLGCLSLGQCGRAGPPLPRRVYEPPPPTVHLAGRWGNEILVRIPGGREDRFFYRFYPGGDLCAPPQRGVLEQTPWEGWYRFSARVSGSVEFSRKEEGAPGSPWFIPPVSAPASGEALPLNEVVSPQGEVTLVAPAVPPQVSLFLEQERGGEYLPRGEVALPFKAGRFPPQTILNFRYLFFLKTEAGLLFLTPPLSLRVEVP